MSSYDKDEKLAEDNTRNNKLSEDDIRQLVEYFKLLIEIEESHNT